MWLRIVICVGVALSLCKSAAALPSGVGALTWSDEFDGSELDLTKWFHRATGPRGAAVDNAVLTPNAVSEGNGLLTIKTYTEGGKNYSGMIGNYLYNPDFGVGATNGLNQKYGYFEVRAKFHDTSGTASAFWLQSATIGNPIGNPQAAGVEMDIFEHRVYDALDPSAWGITSSTDITNRSHEALIWDGYGASQHLTTNLTNTLPGLSNDTWHTFGLKWTSSSTTFYYDSVPIWTGSGGAVSQAPEYIILSSEVNSAFAGAIPQGGYGARGDFNNDGVVDAADYVVWRDTVGQSVGRGSGADADYDGIIDQGDFDVWRANFGLIASKTNVQIDYVRAYGLVGAGGGSAAGESNFVPEPSGLALLVVGMIAFAHRRRVCREFAHGDIARGHFNSFDKAQIRWNQINDEPLSR